MVLFFHDGGDELEKTFPSRAKCVVQPCRQKSTASVLHLSTLLLPRGLAVALFLHGAIYLAGARQ